MKLSRLGQTKLEYALILTFIVIASAGFVAIFPSEGKKLVCELTKRMGVLFYDDDVVRDGWIEEFCPAKYFEQSPNLN